MRLIRALPVLVSLGLAASAFASPPRFLDRAAYTDRLQALWLAQVIANWTGLLTEGQRIAPPFFTDADWGTTPPGMTRQLVFITSQNPWGADDDTDIEYVYAQELFNADHALLTGAGLRQAWIDHINRFIWVSNAQARALMNRGMAPPATGLFLPNTAALHIDAQLTTEIFGAFAPGMPEAALRLADLPIRTTACGHAAHAAQFHVALYSLAALLDTSLPPREQAVWLVTSARAFVPDTSKTADVIDTVLADFLANPDASDWERTRDLIYQRYQLNAWPNGFLYRAWFESSVNLATGVLALLYGEMDLKRTIQIGTLSGWDSDNGTATMGGLIGLVQGTQAVRDAFQGVTLSDRFWIRRTRDNIHDYLPADAGAEDTFRLMSERHITIVDRIIAEQGGQVDLALQRFALPPVPPAPPIDPLELSPTQRLHNRSANNRVRDQGGTVSASSSVVAAPPGPAASSNIAIIADGVEHNFSGLDLRYFSSPYYSTQNAPIAPGAPVTFTVTYDRGVEVERIRLVEGDHFNSPTGTNGGWFTSLEAETRIDGVWTPVPVTLAEPLSDSIPYQILDLILDEPLTATGIRVTGAVGGTTGFVTLIELDAFAPETPLPTSSTDLNSDEVTDAEDLYRWHAQPVSLTGTDAPADPDRRYLQAIIRWPEPHDTTAPQ